jgi:hypothetical protein
MTFMTILTIFSLPFTFQQEVAPDAQPQKGLQAAELGLKLGVKVRPRVHGYFCAPK